MKKYIITALISIILFACMEERGTYDYITPNKVKIDSIIGENGDKMSIPSVEMFDTLRITPIISQSKYEPEDAIFTADTSSIDSSRVNTLAQDESNLEFIWSMYNLLDSEADTISRDRNLEWIVSKSPGNYEARLFVKDKETGLVTKYSFEINITGKTTGGVLMLSDIDGSKALTLLNSAGNLSSEFYENANNTNIDRDAELIINAINPQVPYLKNLYIFTNNGGEAISSVDFSKVKTFDELFYIAPDVKNPQAYYQSNFGGWLARWDVLINNGRVYPREIWYASYAYNEGNNFEEAKFMSDYPGDYYMSKYAIVNRATMMFYDNKNYKFLKPKVSGISISEVLYSCNNNPDSTAIEEFNPDSVGMKLIFMDDSKSSYGYAIMKEPNTEKYFRLKFNVGSMLYSGKWVSYWKKEISQSVVDENIGNATNYTISRCDPYMYYCKENLVYRYDLEYDVNIPILNCDTIVPNSQIDYVYIQDYYQSTSTKYNLKLYVAHSKKNATGKCGSLSVVDLNRGGEVVRIDTTYMNVNGRVISMDWK